MGFCGGCCKIVMTIWLVVAMLLAIAIVGLMSFKISGFKDTYAAEVVPLMEKIRGQAWYRDLSIIQLNKFTYYAGLGLATLSFVAFLIHMIAACKNSRCLLGLSSLFIFISMVAIILGIVFRFEVLSSMDKNLTPVLNSTLVNDYNETESLTAAWDYVTSNGTCCGVEGIKDYNYTKHWSGEVKLGRLPCPTNLDKGCREVVADYYLELNSIWLTGLFAALTFFLFVLLLFTICVCKYGFNKHRDLDYGSVESYSLQRKR